MQVRACFSRCRHVEALAPRQRCGCLRLAHRLRSVPTDFSVEEQVHSFLSSYMPPFQFTKEENAAHSTASGRVSVISLKFAHWLPWKRHHPSPLPILPCSPCLREPLPLRCSSCCHAPGVRCDVLELGIREVPRTAYATRVSGSENNGPTFWLPVAATSRIPHVNL